MTPPKLFVSYSWTDPDHVQWVIELSTCLREQGVDVILDKWDLQEGHDANAFMEKMVNDPDVKKVIMISDEEYARKANDRSGGVGTEALIISQEVYQSTVQAKFVAVLPTRDAQGKPYLPTYFKGRIFIDLSNPNTYAEEFDKLLRWIFDKPLNIKPPIGVVPSFLLDGPQISLGTEATFVRVIDAIKAGKSTAYGALADYLQTFTTNLERFRPVVSQDVEFCDASLEMITQFTSFRDQFAQCITTICRYPYTLDTQRHIHAFFERLLPMTGLPQSFLGHYRRDQFDVFRFIAYELFLLSLAISIGEERYDFAERLLSAPYFHSTGGVEREGAAVSYTKFQMPIVIFDQINQKKETRFLEPLGEFIKDRSQTGPVSLQRIMQADFILYLRARVMQHGYWWPYTLIHAHGQHGPFEIFARASSTAYFEQFKGLLGVRTVAELKAAIDAINVAPGQGLSWQRIHLSISQLMNYQHIGTIA